LAAGSTHPTHTGTAHTDPAPGPPLCSYPLVLLPPPRTLSQTEHPSRSEQVIRRGEVRGRRGEMWGAISFVKDTAAKTAADIGKSVHNALTEEDLQEQRRAGQGQAEAEDETEVSALHSTAWPRGSHAVRCPAQVYKQLLENLQFEQLKLSNEYQRSVAQKEVRAVRARCCAAVRLADAGARSAGVAGKIRSGQRRQARTEPRGSGCGSQG
jgi:hypothetical protein